MFENNKNCHLDLIIFIRKYSYKFIILTLTIKEEHFFLVNFNFI